MYVLYDGEGGDDRSEAETLEMDEAYDRASLELARTECNVPELVGILLFLRHNTADHTLCSAMATMSIPINSSLVMKARVVIVNNGRIISPLRRACIAFRTGLVRRVLFS